MYSGSSEVSEPIYLIFKQYTVLPLVITKHILYFGFKHNICLSDAYKKQAWLSALTAAEHNYTQR